MHPAERMEDRSWRDEAGLPAAWLESEVEPLAKPAILLVEDDDDIRELLVTLLTLANFAPVATSSAEDALERLREQEFDLVLTDYALPNRTGGWLLRQASEEGLLDATPALVVTAHPSPRDTEGFEVICKPFDLDDLVERVRQRLENGDTGRIRRRPVRTSPGAAPGGDMAGSGSSDCPDPIELILYVSAHSPRSASAIENIRRIVGRFKSNRVRLTICDLSQDPSLGNPDGIAFTPTIVRRSPGPRTFILGHITSPELLLELLADCQES